MSNKNNLKISGALYTLGSILSASISFIFIPLFMSEFTVDEYGIYSLILICSAIGAAIFYLGVTSALTRSYFDYEQQEEKNNCFYTTLVLLSFGGVAQVLLGYLSSDYISLLLFEHSNWSDEIFIGLTASSFGFLNFAFLSYFRLVNKPYHFFIFSVFTVLSNVLCVYYFVVINQQGVLGAVKGPLVSQSFLFVLFCLYHYKLIIQSKYLKSESILQLKYGFYTVLSSLGGLAILWADQFFINKYLSLSDVGVYALAVKLASIITVIFTVPFVQVFNPIVMEQRKNEGVKELISKSYKIYIIIGLCLSILISFSAEEFIYLFDKNESYSDAIIYIYPLMLSVCVYGLVNIVSIGLSFERKLGRQTIVFLGFSLVNVLLNFVLIPNHGVWGAITSTFITYLLITLSLGIVSNRVYKVGYSYQFTWCIMAASILFLFFNTYFIVGSDLFYRIIYKLLVLVSIVVFVSIYFKPFQKFKLFFSKSKFI